MYLIQILLPCADNSGVPFSRNDFEQLKHELAADFKGVTAFIQAPAEGTWRAQSREDHDDIVVFEIMAEDVESDAWKGRRAELERRFRQERVIIRYMQIGLI